MFHGILRFQRELFRTEDELAVQLCSVRKLIQDDEGHLEHKKFVTIKGFGLPKKDRAEGIDYEMKGEWTKHPKFGWQVKITGFREYVQNTRDGILKFLSHGPLEGCGMVTAKIIYNAFGDDTIKVLNKNPDALLKVEGITEKKARKMIQSWKENTAARDVMSTLMPLDMPASLCMKIVKRYHMASMDIIRTQPWRLVKEIPGISFSTVDTLVHKLGLPLDTDERIQAAIEFALLTHESTGSMGETVQELFKDTKELLRNEISDARITSVRNQLLLDHSIHAVRANGNTYLLRGNAYDAETLLAKRLTEVLGYKRKMPKKEDIEAAIASVEKECGMHYSEEQKGAVYKALSASVMVLTGGPGVGKTATLNLIASVMEKLLHAKICQLSPTGKAAKLMTESTHRFAQTIDSKLGLMPRIGTFTIDVPQIEEEITIVDESSMLDAYKAVSLLYAIKPGHSIVFVGDINQLPSVGPGNVLKSLIDSGVCPVQRLTKIYRQKGGGENAIVTNAYKVNSGETDIIYHAANFHFVRVESGDQKIAEYLNKSYLHYREQYGKDNVVCLLPTKRTELVGMEDMNRSIQESVNPVEDDKAVKIFGYTIHAGDIVMNTQNNLQKNVVNGDVGTVTEVKKNEDGAYTVSVQFDEKTVEFEGEELQHLSLGYALTVHKSQGSEYDAVVIGLSPKIGPNMEKRNLLYTAITRAKKEVIIIGSKEVMDKCIKTADTGKRFTLLDPLLKMYAKKASSETA